MLLSVPGIARIRRGLLPLVVVALVASTLGVLMAVRASGSDDRCESFAASRLERGHADVGSGPTVAVIGDSYSVGLGLDDPALAWPSRLPGRVHVDGFSGSGFSAGASTCAGVAFDHRAAAAVAGDPDLVVVEGGLNDVDQSSASIEAGFARLLHVLDGHRTVVVGPTAAPARASWVNRVDDLLARLCAEAGVAYLPMTDLRLGYLGDDLHLTPAGHAAFGDAVAVRLAALDPV